MKDQFGAELTAEQADHVAQVAEQHIENLLDRQPGQSEDLLPAIHREKLASLRARRDQALHHAQAVRDRGKREREAEAKGQQEADDELIDAAPEQMAKLAQQVDAGRESTDFLAALVEHVRRVQAAQMATERLAGLVQDVEAAAARRGREPPQAPETPKVPQDADYGLRLFNSGMVDYLLREADGRLRS